MGKIEMNYYEIYEKLYSIGYHSKLKNHGRRYVKYLCSRFPFKTVLDVGCSNGQAVKEFKKLRKRAFGLDASDIAVRYAGSKSYVSNCVLASATDIPFKDNFFDAVFSCDMLEHLTERDAAKAIKELIRVSNKYLFLIIDGEEERNRDWLIKAKKEFPKVFKDIENLHLTVLPVEKWKEKFLNRGCKFKEHAEVVPGDGLDVMIFEVP